MIPWPIQYEKQAGTLDLTGRSRIVASEPALLPLACVLADEIAQLGGPRLVPVCGAPQPGDIALVLDTSLEGEEHRVDIAAFAEVRAATYPALAAGTTTLLHEMEIGNGPVRLPAGRIVDRPFAPYRAVMMDAARNWHRLETLKQMVMLCRFYKLNYLHLHLSDNESYVVPSSKYPAASTPSRHFSLQDLRGLETFARDRGVTILPEIEMPGHSLALQAALPRLSCEPSSDQAMCPGQESTYEILDTLIGETCDIFRTTPWFHIGADETTTAPWANCRHCRDYMQKHGLDGPDELYRHFIVRMNDIVKKHGKKTIVWEGFAKEGRVDIPRDVTVMIFECMYNLPPDLLTAGYSVINASWQPLYVVGEWKNWPPEYIYGWNMYRWENWWEKSAAAKNPIEVSPTRQVLGAQMCTWGQDDEMELPSLRRRLPALSERIWNPDAGRTFADFSARLEVADSRLDKLLNLAAKVEPTGGIEIWNLDVSKPAPSDLPVIWQDRNPEGLSLSANRLHFMKDGRPWFPVMGEMHYCRCPHGSWEDELRKMKAGGMEIVATYVLWNHHEREPGQWDWSGDCDLRGFVECARRAGLFVWLRTGPYCNAEARNGGLPDWVEKLPDKRTNDPAYLKHCREVYRQIGAQIKGLCFRDGGPIIGIQLENEYAYGQAEHIATLHAMSREFGMRVPFYSVTGNTVFFNTQDDVIPMQGSYAYRGWEPESGGPTRDFLFGDDAWIMTEDCQRCYYDFTRFPRAAAEMGVGSPMRGDTRFQVDPTLIEAAVQNQIGRGLVLLGYYMFHGGTQMQGVEGNGWPLTYDFQAPLGEFGQRTPTYDSLRLYHGFLRDYGATLAGMPCLRPAELPRDPADTRKPRFVVRSNGKSGFVFLNNTQKKVSMPGKRLRLALQTANGPLQIPGDSHAPIFLRDKTCAMLPFNLDLGGMTLAWATVQPFARIEVNGVPWHFFFRDPLTGSIPVFGFQDEVAITDSDGKQTIGKAFEGGCRSDFEWWDLRQAGARCRVFLFPKEMAKNVYRIKLAGMERLVITSAQLIERDGAIELRSRAREFDLSVIPALSASLIPRQESVKLIDGPGTNVMSTHTIRIPQTDFAIDEPVLGKDRTRIRVPAQWPDTWSEFLVEVDYLGSSADLLVCGKKKTDHLMYGPAWVIGVSRFMPEAGKGGLEFHVQPWHDGITGVAPEKERLIRETGDAAAVIRSVRVWPEYRAELRIL